MGLNCKCPTSFLNDQTREFPIIILGIYTVSKTGKEAYLGPEPEKEPIALRLS